MKFKIPLIGSIVREVIDLIKKPTPQKGKDLAKKGALLAGGSAATLTGVSMLEATDEVTAMIIAATQFVTAITALIGAIATVAGKSQVENLN